MEDNMTKEIRCDERINIINQIIGSINGIGETNHDDEVLNSLDFLEILLADIFYTLKDNAYYEGFEGSRITIKEKTLELLRDCRDTIDVLLEE